MSGSTNLDEFSEGLSPTPNVPLGAFAGLAGSVNNGNPNSNGPTPYNLDSLCQTPARSHVTAFVPLRPNPVQPNDNKKLYKDALAAANTGAIPDDEMDDGNDEPPRFAFNPSIYAATPANLMPAPSVWASAAIGPAPLVHAVSEQNMVQQIVAQPAAHKMPAKEKDYFNMRDRSFIPTWAMREASFVNRSLPQKHIATKPKIVTNIETAGELCRKHDLTVAYGPARPTPPGPEVPRKPTCYIVNDATYGTGWSSPVWFTENESWPSIASESTRSAASVGLPIGGLLVLAAMHYHRRHGNTRPSGAISVTNVTGFGIEVVAGTRLFLDMQGSAGRTLVAGHDNKASAPGFPSMWDYLVMEDKGLGGAFYVMAEPAPIKTNTKWVDFSEYFRPLGHYGTSERTVMARLAWVTRDAPQTAHCPFYRSMYYNTIVEWPELNASRPRNNSTGKQNRLPRDNYNLEGAVDVRCRPADIFATRDDSNARMLNYLVVDYSGVDDNRFGVFAEQMETAMYSFAPDRIPVFRRGLIQLYALDYPDLVHMGYPKEAISATFNGVLAGGKLKAHPANRDAGLAFLQWVATTAEGAPGMNATLGMWCSAFRLTPASGIFKILETGSSDETRALRKKVWYAYTKMIVERSHLLLAHSTSRQNSANGCVKLLLQNPPMVSPLVSYGTSFAKLMSHRSRPAGHVLWTRDMSGNVPPGFISAFLLQMAGFYPEMTDWEFATLWNVANPETGDVLGGEEKHCQSAASILTTDTAGLLIGLHWVSNTLYVKGTKGPVKVATVDSSRQMQPQWSDINLIAPSKVKHLCPYFGLLIAVSSLWFNTFNA